MMYRLRNWWFWRPLRRHFRQDRGYWNEREGVWERGVKRTGR